MKVIYCHDKNNGVKKITYGYVTNNGDFLEGLDELAEGEIAVIKILGDANSIYCPRSLRKFAYKAYKTLG